MTPDGRTVWEWRSWEHLDPAIDVITAAQDDRSEWTHGNAVVELSDGNLLVSFRNISTIVRIDRSTGKIAWRLGAPPLSGQHAPTPLPNGHLLIFDNGPHRVDQSFPFSRVIEIDPATKQIVWKYQEPVPQNCYSRAFPTLNDCRTATLWAGDRTARRAGQLVFRVYRYSEEEIAQARRMV